MKTVNSVSGGKTSAYIAVHYPADYEIFSLVCIDEPKCAPKDKGLTAYVRNKLAPYTEEFGEFIATAEDDQTLVALRDLEQFIGREIIWVRDKSFDKLLTSKRTFGGEPSRLPSWARRYCTMEMKLYPIFKWWFWNVGEKVQMRLGFRFDEFDRMERFLNNKPEGFKIPVSCKNYGNRQQQHQAFDWRYCHFPLVKNVITKRHIEEFWADKYVPGDLFTERKKITFPAISNCVGCFHKSEETLAAMCVLHPEKMQWFSEQESLGKGTWLDNKKPYAEIAQNAVETAKETLAEIIYAGQSCDSGGCTD